MLWLGSANCQSIPYPDQLMTKATAKRWLSFLETGYQIYLLYPYYKKDIEQGRITREEARELLEELLLKIMSQNIRPESNILSNFYQRYLGSSPVTIGGIRPDGKDGTNELTFLFLEAAARSKPVTNIALRVHKDMPDEVLLAAANVLYSGASNIALFYDDANIKAMERRGFESKDSINYAVMGCVEMLCPGKTGGMSANALLLSRLLDITFEMAIRGH
jgi:formate C-acetyltransferase